MIDIDPNTGLTGNTGVTGDTVEQVRDHSDKGDSGAIGKANYYIYSSNHRNLSTGHDVATTPEPGCRPGTTGKTGRTASQDMPGKLEAGKTGVHRTPTKEGFCFGNTSGIL